MTRLFGQVGTSLGLLCLAGCALPLHRGPVTVTTACAGGDVIFAVDGAGCFHGMSRMLRRAVAAEGMPLVVATFEWSHGYGRVVADQCDYDHARAEGRRLAELIRERRLLFPDQHIYLFAHCAGSATALAAAELLPPDTIDRIVLLAPSLSSDYDLRPSLRASRDGIDVFCSAYDRYLCFGILLLGTADAGHFCAVSGRRGFQPIVTSDADRALYARLRQHYWNESLIREGHCGGHYGAYQQRHLRREILPLLREPVADWTIENHRSATSKVSRSLKRPSAGS